MRMLCYKCNHSWTYRGSLSEGKIYVTCPNCMRKVRVDRALVEDSTEQRLLTSVSKKGVETTSFPLKLPITTTTTSFIEVEKDIFVEKNIAKQFKEAQEETPLPGIGVEEQEPVIKILSKEILITSEDQYSKEERILKLNVRPLTDHLGTIKILPPKFEIIRIIPRDPIKHLEHMKNYYF